MTPEAAASVHLKVCVNAEWVESLTALGFMEDVVTYNELTDTRLWTFLDEKPRNLRKFSP